MIKTDDIKLFLKGIPNSYSQVFFSDNRVFAYMLLVHRTTYLYCIMLPFGLVASLGWATPLVCAVIAYTFFGLDALSEELEEPFGLAANQLPLTALSRTIEINLREALGETNLPTDIMPIDGYLP